MPAAAGRNEPGSTPRPSAKVIQEYNQYIGRVVDPENVLDLIVGRPRLLILKEPPRRIQIAAASPQGGGAKGAQGAAGGRVASFVLITDTELSVLGEQVGTTVLNIWFADPKDPTKQRILSYLVRVLPDPSVRDRRDQDREELLERARLERQRHYKRLEAEINHAFPDSVICLEVVEENVVLSGQAKDIAEATQIIRIVQSNPPRVTAMGTPTQPPTGTTGTTPPGTPATTGPTARVRPMAPPRARNARGGARDDHDQPDVADRSCGGDDPDDANAATGRRPAGPAHRQPDQLAAHARRTTGAAAGHRGRGRPERGPQYRHRLQHHQQLGLTVFTQSTGGLISGTTPTSSANLTALLGNGRLALAIQALRTMSYARSLAEPNLVTLNGQTASFLAGGAFPVPVVSGFTASGLQGVQFVPFGVQVSFTPYITDKDRIRLNVQANVSTRDSTTIEVSGSQVPTNLNTRNFSTVVELREGQTLAVAGLIQNNITAAATRVPWFGDLPYVGRLFALDTASAADQELIMLVTPELVHPLDPKELPPLPGSDIFEPSDLEFYLFGRLESRRDYDFRSPRAPTSTA